MWTFFKFLLGPIGRILSGYGDYRNQKSIIEAGVITSVIQSDIEINRVKLQMAAINQQWWVTRWIMPAFAYPVAAHFGAVILDSIFHFSWNIAALPKPLDEWEGQIILSFFIVGTAERLVSQWLNRGIVQSLAATTREVFGFHR